MRGAALPLLALWLAAVPAGGPGRAQGPDDPLAPVVARVRAHDPGGALRQLARLPPEARRAAPARYLRARLLERVGRLGEAADALADRGGLPEAVARSARRRRAILLVRSDRCAEAAPALEELGEGDGAQAAVLRALAAECALRQGQHESAIDRLRAAAREDARRVDTFGVRMQLAEALHRRGDAEAAVAELRDLLVDRPEHPDTRHAVAQLEVLGAAPDLEPEQRLARAERLLRLRRPRDALSELEAIDAPTARADRARFLHLRGMALYRTRHHYAEAARVLGEAARLGGPHAVDDELHAARALSRADRDDRAIRAYRRLVRRHPRHPRAAQAEYLAAWLELHHGRAAGERHMRRFLAGPRGGQSPRRERAALWSLALRAFERGRHARASRLFARYAERGDGAMIAGRGAYWRGRALAAAGERRAAAAAYREAAYLEPLHWYSLLARERLAALGEDELPPFPPEEASAEAEPERGAAEAPEPPPSPQLPAPVAFWAELGLRADAAAALRRRERQVRHAAPEGRRLETLLAAYAAVGEVSRPYRLAVIRRRGALRRAPGPGTRWIWQAAYPRPWARHVRAAARARDLPPELLWAIMRQESGYDPDAVSYADAIGLLQLLPSAALRLGERLGVEPRRETLFDPAWNVRFGALHVAQAFAALDGRLPLAIAAYNAGVANVRRWLRERGELPIDLFVERIPFRQTRGYVRRVVSHYARYRYLADPEQGWPLTLLRSAP